MPVAAVDTNGIIGMADTDDQHHADAIDILHGIDHDELPTVRLTNYAVLESLNWIHTRHRHEKAVETYQRLDRSAGFEIVHAAQKDFAGAVDLFERRDDLSFGDATLAAFMERENIEYLYSFDDDFDRFDHVTRLDRAVNPFE